jgi:hypothetical protein
MEDNTDLISASLKPVNLMKQHTELNKYSFTKSICLVCKFKKFL